MATLQDLLTQNTSDVAALTVTVGQVVTALQAGGAPTQAQLDQLAAANSQLETANSQLQAALGGVPAPTPAPTAFSGLPFTKG